MKYLQWLNKAGKTSMAALAGLGGVAAVAGVASWMYINGGDDGNSFHLGSQQPTNIVYTSGGNADYNTYGAQEQGSSVALASSRNLKIMEQEDLRAAQREQLAESERLAGQAYGTSESSALVGNSDFQGEKIPEFESMMGGKNPMAGMPDIQGLMAKATANMGGSGAQGGAANGAAGGAGRGAAGGNKGPAALSSQGKRDWTTSAALGGRGGGSGEAGANQFVLQANGRGKAVDPASAMAEVGDVVKRAQQEAAALMDSSRDAGKAARASFKNNKVTDRDSHGGRAQDRARALDRLQFAQKRSAQEASNKNRMAVSTAFLDGNKITGGITLSDGGVGVTTGMGQASKDFNTSFGAGLGKLQEVGKQLVDEELQRRQDRQNLQAKIWRTVGIIVTVMMAIAYLMKMFRRAVTPWEKVAYFVGAIVAAGIGLYSIGDLWVAANEFKHRWNEHTLRDASRIVGVLGTLGIAATFIISYKQAQKAIKKAAEEAVKKAAAGIKEFFSKMTFPF